MKKIIYIVSGILIFTLGFIFIIKQRSQKPNYIHRKHDHNAGQVKDITPCKPEETCDYNNEVYREISKSGELGLIGTYTTATGVENEYYQTIAISPKDDVFLVEFSASHIKGEPGCSFIGIGTMEEGRLLLKQEDLTITVKPVDVGVVVDTLDPTKKQLLSGYCKNGSTLVGEYKRI